VGYYRIPRPVTGTALLSVLTSIPVGQRQFNPLRFASDIFIYGRILLRKDSVGSLLNERTGHVNFTEDFQQNLATDFVNLIIFGEEYKL
jgi:hypothetical protein